MQLTCTVSSRADAALGSLFHNFSFSRRFLRWVLGIDIVMIPEFFSFLLIGQGVVTSLNVS